MSISTGLPPLHVKPALASLGMQEKLPRVLKRGIDIVAAAGLLLFLAPVMLVVSLLVAMDGGPVLFGHRRIGRNGRTFACLKFRSMVVGAEEMLPQYLELHPEAAVEWDRDQKLTFDPRVTGIGKILRKTSLDEVPQLINVLRGEMSLVGPRPVTAAELEDRYGPHARTYALVQPGVSGLWQVSGRSDVSYEERVALDVRYVQNWSLAQDIRIMLQTVRVALSRNGAC